MSGFHLGQVPFRQVIIHGLVRDKTGRKFSKSLGNGVDPLDMVAKYGADAVRLGLLFGTAIGSDVKFDEAKIKGQKHFANKLWNITRFILENASEASSGPDLTETDQALTDQLDQIIAAITEEMENYRFHLASEKLYHYVWDELADKILEASKLILKDNDTHAAESRRRFLRETLEKVLIILHPFMPFITEEIWQTLGKAELLMVEPWPIKPSVL